MKTTVLRRTLLTMILAAVLWPAALAYAGLPGPYPSSLPSGLTPPPDSNFNYVKVDDARDRHGVDFQIDFGTTGGDHPGRPWF